MCIDKRERGLASAAWKKDRQVDQDLTIATVGQRGWDKTEHLSSLWGQGCAGYNVAIMSKAAVGRPPRVSQRRYGLGCRRRLCIKHRILLDNDMMSLDKDNSGQQQDLAETNERAGMMNTRLWVLFIRSFSIAPRHHAQVPKSKST